MDKAGIPSNADSSSKPSIAVALGIARALKAPSGLRLDGQTSGKAFEVACRGFLESTFGRLAHLRPGRWHVGPPTPAGIAQYDQYSHLIELSKALEKMPQLKATFGGDYYIKPDIVISRDPEPDESINEREMLVDNRTATRSSLRQVSGGGSDSAREYLLQVDDQK